MPGSHGRRVAAMASALLARLAVEQGAGVSFLPGRAVLSPELEAALSRALCADPDDMDAADIDVGVGAVAVGIAPSCAPSSPDVDSTSSPSAVASSTEAPRRETQGDGGRGEAPPASSPLRFTPSTPSDPSLTPCAAFPPVPTRRVAPVATPIPLPDGAGGDAERARRQAALAALNARVAACDACPELHARRQRAVFGEGAPDAALFFVGEAPALEEEECGRPFMGPAGLLLSDMIEKGLGIPRARVFLSTLVLCRPPGHRAARGAELDACQSFFDEQLDIVRPRVLVALGERAVRRLTGTSAPFSTYRGKWLEYRGVPMRAVHHPMYLRRGRAANGGRHTAADRAAFVDLLAIKERLAESST